MKSSRQSLIISSILHLLMFIVLAYVVLPPTYRTEEFLNSLFMDMVELRQPVVRAQSPPKPQVKPEVKPETTQETKKLLELEPPKPAIFAPSIGSLVSDRVRSASSDKTEVANISPGRIGALSTQPLSLKPIPRSKDDKDIAVIPDLFQDEENPPNPLFKGGASKSPQPPLQGGEGSTTGFTGSQAGPGGAVSKGQSSQYIYPEGSSQRRRGSGEFAEILPALAQSILDRTTQNKVDIIFVIDTSGSMRDNVHGVKEYIHRFLEPLEEKGIDAALGLVEFADQETMETRVVGVTRDQKKFKKWLDKTRFFGGEDTPESGYEALIAALEKSDFRGGAQKFFIFISDAPQHDLDYDGMSRYSLDRIIAKMNKEGVSVDVVGANYLPIKQLAWGTGGWWKHIPGGDPLEDVPYRAPTMIRSALDNSLPPTLVEDKVTVAFVNSAPDWVDLSYKMLDPLGFKCLGTLTYRKKIRYKAEKSVEFYPKIDLREFGGKPGTYTLIYRIRDSIGNWDILRRTLELRRVDG